MTNPVLVDVTRGDLVESRHRGMVAVVDGDGSLVFSLGDIDATVFPRSACKAMQALPLVESGAADAYGFGNAELALSAASHSGEPAHATLAAAMLARAGRDETVLECGANWSFEQPVLIESDAAEALYGDPFLMVAAQVLDGYHGIARVPPMREVTVVTLEFEGDEVVYANAGAMFLCGAQADLLSAPEAAGGYTVLPDWLARDFIDCLE